MNGVLLLVFEVLEGSSTVIVVLVDFLPLTLLFWRQRRQNDGGKEKNPWLLGKMFENRFPDASGREEG